ncbi:MAG: transglycosylase domain-containing protein, partial [Chloroflexota bacterium]
MSLAITQARKRGPIRHPVARLVGSSSSRSALWVVLMCAVGLLAFTLVGIVAAAIWLIAWFGQFAGALPPPDQLTARAPFQTTPILADDGSTVLYEITDPQGGRRTIVKLSQMPRSLIEATIATEDAGFFSNPGFEIRAIFRATVEDLAHQELLSGASTITQQVVRNVLLTPQERLDRSGRRKVKEIIIAYQLTQTYTKDEILSVYMNEIPYGNRSYGVEAAAETYFGKPATQLDLAQAAMLAGIPQAPSYYDPYQNPEAVKDRQSYVLQRMVDQGYISESQASAAAAEPLHFIDRQRAAIAPHFVNDVSNLLRSQLGTERLYHGGDHVITTLDVPLQAMAERAVTSNPSVAAKGSGVNAALVAIDPRSGKVLAMVGSADYGDASIAGEVNMALAPRQSTGILAPFTYALALSHGQTLLSSVIDEPLESAQGTVLLNSATNPHQYLGPVTLRQAIGLGLAAPALQILKNLGSQSLIDLMTRSDLASFKQEVDYTPSLIVAGARVSPIQVAQAYAMLANGGTAHPTSVIDQIVDPSGKVVLRTPDKSSAALSTGVAYLVSSALADPSVRPPDVQRALDLDRPVAFHAATSDDRRDSWA